MNVAGYVRVSTEEQAVHGLSIDAQKRSIELWADNTKDVKLVGIYSDEGVSARKQASKRKELCRLLDDVQNGMIDMIVFTKLDRWTRNVREYHKCQEILENNNVSWRTLQEDYETQTASGRLKVNIMLSVAEEEADRTSERIKAINEMKRAKGLPLTGQLPFGYKLKDKTVIKDENEEAVNKLFDTFMNTGSITAAIDRCGYTQMTRRIANNILSSTAYYGEYWGMSDICPPYITKEEYKTIQSMRKNYARIPSRNRVYMFSGICFCAVCGRRMVGTTTRDKYASYKCENHFAQRVCPNNIVRSEAKIEKFLIENVDEEMRKCSAELSREDNTEKIEELQQKKQRIVDVYIAGMITLDQVKRESEIIEKEIEKLKTPSKDYNYILHSDWKKLYLELNKEQKKAFWRKMIKGVRIDGIGNMSFSLL